MIWYFILSLCRSSLILWVPLEDWTKPILNCLFTNLSFAVSVLGIPLTCEYRAHFLNYAPATEPIALYRNEARTRKGHQPSSMDRIGILGLVYDPIMPKCLAVGDAFSRYCKTAATSEAPDRGCNHDLFAWLGWHEARSQMAHAHKSMKPASPFVRKTLHRILGKSQCRNNSILSDLRAIYLLKGLSRINILSNNTSKSDDIWFLELFLNKNKF